MIESLTHYFIGIVIGIIIGFHAGFYAKKVITSD